MAIQLNDRDHLIFKLINEHHVLLEKHISWFISGEEKPVLIRDRLRKLFYLDYLLCQRHNTKLPWWTTPTKPLVYMLSPISKSMFAIADGGDIDLLDDDIQRHLLEIANIRMMCLVAQRAGEIADLSWTTKNPMSNSQGLDATISFRSAAALQNIGIINHPDCQNGLILDLQNAFANDAIQTVAIISRDQVHQEAIYQKCTQSASALPLEKILLTTHQDLYKAGITKAAWLSAARTPSRLIEHPLAVPEAVADWSDSFAASA